MNGKGMVKIVSVIVAITVALLASSLVDVALPSGDERVIVGFKSGVATAAHLIRQYGGTVIERIECNT